MGSKIQSATLQLNLTFLNYILTPKHKMSGFDWTGQPLAHTVPMES